MIACLAQVLVLWLSTSSASKDNRLLLISLDGFRWDYLNGRVRTPHFDVIKRAGVRARYGLVNEFVSNTYPNHYTLVTGLHVETHGIVDNFMFDPHLEDSFVPAFHDPKHVNDEAWHHFIGTPIWVANQHHRGRSGVIMWMGGEATIGGHRPTRHVAFDPEVKDKDKVDTMLSWFSDPHEPINLGVLYITEPDLLAHQYGPDSEQVSRKIEELDQLVGYLMKSLDRLGLLSSTDVILTSDHGFTSVSRERLIPLDDLVNPSWYTVSSYMPGPLANIFPKPGKEDVIARALETASLQNGRFRVFRKEEIPERFHYKNHRRISDIVLLADLGYTFTQNMSRDDFLLRGNHGYDNLLQTMHPFFLAQGPSFKRGFAVDHFPSVDVYPLMCLLLHIQPAPHNGSLDIVKDLLKEQPDLYPPPTWGGQQWLVLGAILLLMVSVAVWSGVRRSPQSVMRKEN